MYFHCQLWTLSLIAMSNSPYQLNCSTVWLTCLHDRLSCYSRDNPKLGRKPFASVHLSATCRLCAAFCCPMLLWMVLPHQGLFFVGQMLNYV